MKVTSGSAEDVRGLQVSTRPASTSGDLCSEAINMTDLPLSLKSGWINISPIFIHHSTFTETKHEMTNDAIRCSTQLGAAWTHVSRCLCLSRESRRRDDWLTRRTYAPVTDNLIDPLTWNWYLIKTKTYFWDSVFWDVGQTNTKLLSSPQATFLKDFLHFVGD